MRATLGANKSLTKSMAHALHHVHKKENKENTAEENAIIAALLEETRVLKETVRQLTNCSTTYHVSLAIVYLYFVYRLSCSYFAMIILYEGIRPLYPEWRVGRWYS